ncbi:MAG: methylmalonyl-CoA epimerase [Chloroflexi bacterium]|nr:methylmalonyl-CoA epimerase [Chloroflexota bacterium]PWB43207.1 MAG: methylmalonyl-CoA epimerase [Dehalococcoidia bacterium]
MKATRIDHVGIVVKDIDSALATYTRNFGFATDAKRGADLPALGIKNAFMPVGESDLEFIQPTSPEGPVAQFAAERGEGTFMLSLEVDDIDAAVEHLRAAGARVGNPNNGVAFVSMKSTHGVNLQLVQRR